MSSHMAASPRILDVGRCVSIIQTQPSTSKGRVGMFPGYALHGTSPGFLMT